MDKKIISGVLVFALVITVIGLMIPGADRPPDQTFPWQIEVTANGSIQVFGLVLGDSTLQHAQQVFGPMTELSLFEPAPGKGHRAVEAYFDKVNLGGLSAKVVVVLAFSQEQLQGIFERGIRISTLGDGSRKVSLSVQDNNLANQATIFTVTYLPQVRLEPDLLEKRFGKPEKLLIEDATKTRHWLYPGLGLDIALDEKNKAVLQYIAPAEFSYLLKPLR